MFVTTAGRTNEEMIERALQISEFLQVPYLPRKKKSIYHIQNQADSDCIVVGKERLELFEKNTNQPFFFHPNSAMFRIKRLISGDYDPFADAVKLTKGMTFLDCTLGLASDAIIASFLVGREGVVTGIEGQKYLAFIVQQGLQTWDSGLPVMDEAMNRIRVIQTNARDYLKSQRDSSADCVYFDPMFEETILESDGIKALGHFAIHDNLTVEMITEAIRVAKYRVVLKDHYKSLRFEKYGFQVKRRKTAKFHFGVIEKN
ncbi:putative SAM-dependent methyltransferase [Neobacillus bataviensis]|uniref:Putative SAM-dependent methyltransferase n=1 Tax=Neobacillus bataviensis TaxID=220685 RepID=A0A561DRX2_9BACI|nr:class I SAM-dependent methyltransferase [Neobacillus bataviensis]TWE06104.1 putative SAM-dependent methyltransferase [Neobacillus bataviensis]